MPRETVDFLDNYIVRHEMLTSDDLRCIPSNVYFGTQILSDSPLQVFPDWPMMGCASTSLWGIINSARDSENSTILGIQRRS